MTARLSTPVRRLLAGLLAMLLGAGVLGTAFAGTASAASTDPAALAALPPTVTADPLPTVQINGIVWAQAVAGNTVYVAGKFTTARPAGAAAGTQEVTRNNMLAYDIRTGELISSFNPNLNGQGLALAVSPDGKRVYVGGDFTSVGGVSRSRVAAFDTTTGALISSFAPAVTGAVRAIGTSGSTVYLGGSISAVGKTSRTRVAAVDTSGALLPWAPVPGVGQPDSKGNTSSTVRALVVTNGGAQVVLGGAFYSMNGEVTHGVAAVDGTTGANRPFAMSQVVTNEGANSSIYSLSTDGTYVFGTGYDFYGPGNLENSFAALPDGGDVVWMNGCHGDTYSAAPLGGVLYMAGHPHVCEAIGDFPEQNPRISQYSLATTTAATGTNVGWDFNGRPAPTVLDWRPDFSVGTVSGAYQAGWSVATNGNYVLYGGEFTRVSNKAQQGLVRFAVPSVAPRKIGPNGNDGLTPTVTSPSRGAVRVQWTSTFDQDDAVLTYRVTRSDKPGVAVYEGTQVSRWWQRPAMGFIDRDVTPGVRYTYRVTVLDDDGNSTTRSTASVVASDVTPSAYASTVLADGASSYWPLDSLTGGTSYDNAGFADITTGTGMTVVPGSPLGSGSSLAADGTSNGRGTAAATGSGVRAPDTYSLELWFNTTSTTGGRLAGYGNDRTGANGSYDRMLFMDNAGILVYGVYTGNTETIATRPGLNDGQWHHVVAQLSPAGMVLYVDGLKVGSKPGITAGQPYSGYWQIGGGNLGGWPANRTTDEFTGQLAQAAVYPTALTQAQVRGHYTATGRSMNLVPAPTDPYGAAVAADQPTIQWRLDDAAGAATARGSDELGSTGRIVGDVGRTSGIPLPGTTSQGFDLAGRGGYVVADQPTSNPTTFSTEVWFQTTSTNGGRIIGLGNSQGQWSGNYDRFVYMFNDGRLRFGIWGPGENNVDTQAAYNDGDWHHVVATFGPTGMALYVDGAQVGSNGNTSVQPYDGQSYWRLGSDNIWGGANTAALDGRLDEAAVYDRALTPQQVTAHYAAAGRTVPTRPADAYGQAVWDSDPTTWWRMDETSGTTARSSAVSGGAGTYTGGPTLGVPGPTLYGSTANTAVGFDGQDDGVYTRTPLINPTTFSTELWFSSTSASGGKLISFGDRQSGGSSNYDRHVYLQPDGHLTFGTWTGQANLVTSERAYNDGAWHQMVATMGSDGMRLYVDGVEVGFNPNTGAQGYTGYWRVGGDTPWNGDAYIRGSVDEVAIYNRVLSSAEVLGHWNAAGGPVDTAPTAAFTTTVSGLDVAFDGSGSADAEGPVTYRWTFGDGSSATVAKPQHSYAATGSYTATLVVTDTKGQTGTTTQTVTVTAPPANVPPTADFTAAADDLVLRVDASASSDSDGTVAGYAWTFGDGGQATGAMASHTYAAAGTYTVTLTVTDDDRDATTTTRTVTVVAPNQLPSASFTATATYLDLAVDGSASTDADGTIRSYAWDFGDGATATGAAATHSYAAAGSYTVTLTVTDDRGGSTVASKPVAATAVPVPNQAPTASFTSAVADLAAQFDGTASRDADGTVSGYAWTFGDGSTGTGSAPSHRYASAGTWTVTLTVTDDKGATGTTTSTVTTTLPANVAPTAGFTASVTGKVVTVDGASSQDTDGSIAGYAWDFGDGTSAATGAQTTHTYAAAGTYTVTLTVTDDRNGTASTSRTVTIAGPALASDAFGRTVTSGWGTADLGGAWTTTGTASVSGGAGTLTAAAGRTSTAILSGLSETDVAVQATLTVPQAPTGGGSYTSVSAQRVGSSDYRTKVTFRANGTVSVSLVRVLDNVETTLQTVALPSTYAPGTQLVVRFEASGTGNTVLRAKVWVAGSAEPAAWTVQASDSTASLQRAGSVSIQQYVSGSATAAGTVRVDDVWVGRAGTTP